MENKNRRITISILLISCILFTFMTGCQNDGGAIKSVSMDKVYPKGVIPKNISKDEVYPRGDIVKAKIFDICHNEKTVSLNNEDIKFILQTLKDCKKESSDTGYGGGMVELNITFTDSVIQLVRKDNETIYYVFHNGKINGVCYKIQSKDLSQLISKVSS